MLPIINQFVYRPEATFAPPGLTPTALGLNYEEVRLVAADGVRLSGWYLPAPRAKHALLYCHGNAGDIRDWVHAAPPFVSAGVSVLIWDYRGYGKSRGTPSERGLILDGEAAWTWLATRASEDELPVAVLGKSLGSAIACALASKHHLDALILDSAFTSMREVISHHVPWSQTGAIPRLFESIDLASSIHCPTLVIHGGRDHLVPLEQGTRLYQALSGPKTMRVIKQAGHNDISLYTQYHRWIFNYLHDPLTFIGD